MLLNVKFNARMLDWNWAEATAIDMALDESRLEAIDRI